MKQFLIFIAILFLFDGCKEKEPMQDLVSGSTGFMIRAKINGVDYSVTEDSSRYIYNQPYTLWSTNTMFTQGTSFLADSNPDPHYLSDRYFIIQFVETSDNANGPGSNAQVDQMISVKSYNYGRLSNSPDPFAHGVVVTYINGLGNDWTTDGDQTGSSFTIISHEATTPGVTDSGDFSHITEGRFNCKLYDKSGNSMTVTDGYFRGRTVSYWY